MVCQLLAARATAHAGGIKGTAFTSLRGNDPAVASGNSASTARAVKRKRWFTFSGNHPGQTDCFARRANQLNFLSSPSRKNFPLSPSGKSVALICASHPSQGRIASRHERGMRCGGRGGVGAMRVRRAVSHRERTTARWTKGARCVRQNRVVLTPVAGAKISGGEVSPTGLDQPPIRFSTVTRRIRRRGERGISRKAIAQGMPECSDCTCMLVCVSLHTIAHETAGAACTRHSLHPHFRGARFIQTSGAICAARTRSRIQWSHVIASAAKQSIFSYARCQWIASLRSQ